MISEFVKSELASRMDLGCTCLVRQEPTESLQGTGVRLQTPHQRARCCVFCFCQGLCGELQWLGLAKECQRAPEGEVSRPGQCSLLAGPISEAGRSRGRRVPP